jgi:hypothetical protein
VSIHCSSQAIALLTPCAENPCNVTVGHTKRKCTKCANSRHPCVLVEIPLWPTLKKVADARAAYARSLDRDDEEDENIIRRDRAEDLGKELIAELKAFNVNRNQHAGDRTVPRTRRAGAANVSSGPIDPVMLAEVQSIRRGLLALVEVGKAVSIF